MCDETVYDHERYLREKSPEHYRLLTQLRESMESAYSAPFMEKYDQLEFEYREAMDVDLAEYAYGDDCVP